MKRLASITTGLCLALALCIGLARPAAAQLENVNAAMLSGTPFLLVVNGSPTPILAIQAVHASIFSPTAWISIPGGGIAPGGGAIVKFPTYSGGCIQTIFVRTADGMPHTFPNANVCSATRVTIRW